MPFPPRGMPPQAMPPRGMPPQQPASASPMDDLISAQMMQSAVGNPNAPVPTGDAIGRQQRPAIPKNKQPSPKGGTSQQKMIADIFKKKAGTSNKSVRANAGPPTR